MTPNHLLRHTLKTTATMVVALMLCVATMAFSPWCAWADDGGRDISMRGPLDHRDDYFAVLYDNSTGLPTSEANAIAETSEGFIWIGGYAGLIRYDGTHFERVGITEGVASVVSLFVDSSDRLWVGTNDTGMAVLDSGEFRFFTKADGLGSSSVRAIVEDANGNIYAATTMGVAVISPDMEVRPLDDSRLSGAYILDLRCGAGGLVYGLTRDGAVFLIDDGRVIAYHTAEDIGIADISAILPDLENPGLAYFGTKGSTVYHGSLSDLRDAETFDVSPLTSVKSVECYGDTVWVTADNGIGGVVDGTFRQLEDVPLDNSIDQSMVDYQGNLWFVSSRQGVMKLVGDQFLNVSARFHLGPAVVNTTCVYHDMLLIGTDDGLEVTDDRAVVGSIPVTSATTAGGLALEGDDLVEMLDGVRIRSIVRDSEDGIWVSTYGSLGLLHFDGEKVVCYTEDDGMPSSRVRTAVELSNGAVAAACTGGVAIIREGKVARVYGQESGIENTEVLTVCELPTKSLLVGTDGGGMYVLGERGCTRIDVESEQRSGTGGGLHSDVVMRLKRFESHDVTWIVTSNSIAYIDPFLHVTTVRKFPYTNNFDLFEDEIGNMWILSSDGIYVVPTEELLANEKIDPVHYGLSEGLTCIATANSYSDLTEEGDLYIAGTTGVVHVNISEPHTGIDELKMAMPFVEVAGDYLYPDEDGHINVPSNAARLTVHPFVYTYSLMDPQVSYRLEGLEVTPTTTRASELAPIDYTNLKGGTYTFCMQLVGSDGTFGEPLRVIIDKDIALVESPWFRVAVFLGLAALIAAVTRAIDNRRALMLQRRHERDKQYIREMSVAFARVIDLKDTYTSGHSGRVAYYTRLLTRELGYDEDTVESYYNIALLHDIGKIGVDGEVLNKPGRLTDEEFEAIKSHAELGYNALRDISVMPELAVGARSHHERPDGRGYPQGLEGDQIPRVAQIIAVADTFDAMYSDRPYRKRMDFDKAVSIIQEVSGTQLKEDVVEAFLRLVDKGIIERAANDDGNGSLEDIDNIHKRLNDEAKK